MTQEIRRLRGERRRRPRRQRAPQMKAALDAHEGPPPSAPIMCRCGCHCRRSPALATATAPRVAFAARVADELLDRLGAGACELAEQLRPPAKQRSQEAWDGEHHSAQRICFFFSHEGRRAGTTTPPGSATTSSRPTPTSTRLPATLECWPRPPPAGCSAAAADEVGGGVLETLLVFGCDPVAHVGGEAGVSPGEQLPDQLLRDRALVEQDAEQPFAEQPHQPLGVPLGRRVPRAVGTAAAVGGDQVQMRMPLQEVSRGGDRHHDPGSHVAVAARMTDELLDGLGAGARELAEQLPPPAEQRAQEARDGEHHMAVRDSQQHFVAQPLGPQELLLLLARGAEAAATAGEGDQNALAALRTPQPCKAVLEKPALEELPQHSFDHRPQRPMLPNEARRP